MTPAESRGRSHLKPRCLDQDRTGGCPYGDGCRLYHDEGREELKVQKTEDCSFWLDGNCRFTDKACRFIHDQKKKGSRIRQEARKSSGGPFLGQVNPAAQPSIAQPGVGTGLQLITSGGQLYLQQGGQVLGIQQGQQGLQQSGGQGVQVQGAHLVQTGAQLVQPGAQGIQLGLQGGLANSQQGGLGGWRLQ